MDGLYAVELNNKHNVSYVKGKDEMFICSTMGNLHNLELYIENKRGVYILRGENKIYVGEGDVSKRLARHKKNKLWVEEVYIYIKDGMSKEDSLQYEGAFLKTLIELSGFDCDNKDGVRINGIDVSSQMRKFKWVGFEIDYPKVVNITTIQGVVALDLLKTHIGTYKVITSYIDDLAFLINKEFKNLNDVYVLVNTLSVNEGV